MRFLAIYLVVGMFFSYMNAQSYEKACSKPANIKQIVGGVYFFPVLSPFLLMGTLKPESSGYNCEKETP